MSEFKHCKLIDGKEIALRIRQSVKKYVDFLKEKHHVRPGIAVILVGNNEASQIYVRNKIKACAEAGISSYKFELPAEISEDHLVKKIESLNNDPKVHGILVQLPLPSQINAKNIIEIIDPDKDVDGFHPCNMGNLLIGKPGFVPCTPLGCLILLKTVIGNLRGKKAIVIGRSQIVGRPMAALLLNQDCTVTIAHSKSLNLKEECRQADIVIVAAGKAGMLNHEFFKENAVVLDVGINHEISADGKKKLVGDVKFSPELDKLRAISPVPGGVGPMTIACLLSNTIKAAAESRDVKFDFITERF